MTAIEESENDEIGSNNNTISEIAINMVNQIDEAEKNDSADKKCKCTQACNVKRDHCTYKCRCFENGYFLRAEEIFDDTIRGKEFDQAFEKYLKKKAKEDTLDVSPPDDLNDTEKRDYINFHNKYASQLLIEDSDDICDCDKCLPKWEQVFEDVQVDVAKYIFDANSFFECNSEAKNDYYTIDVNNSGPSRKSVNNRQTIISAQNGNNPLSKIVAISFACKDKNCKRFFPSKKELAEHMYIRHQMLPFKCWAGCEDLCFASRNAVIEHNNIVHRNTENWPCELCPGIAFKEFNYLYLHYSREHEYGKFTCNWPNHNETFCFRQDVITHIERIHYRRGLNANGSISRKAQRHKPYSVNQRGGHCERLDDDESQSLVAKSQAEFDRRAKSFPPPISGDKIKEVIRTLDPQTNEEYQYFCKWPGCKKTCRYAWNLRTHIRTTHFKLPKTKMLMQNNQMNVEEIDEIESKYIHIFEC